MSNNDFHGPLGKSTADRLMRQGFSRMVHLERAVKTRGNISRSRFAEANIDWAQLNIRSSRSIVDTDGVFFFIVGLSIVGGGDRVRP